MDETVAAMFGINLLLILASLIGIRSAYRNGVVDGYGYAAEPWNAGYREAGDYLRANMAHRWPELLHHQRRDEP